MSELTVSRGEPRIALLALGRWGVSFCCILIGTAISVFAAFAGIHLFDRNSAPFGTNLSYEMMQSLVCGLAVAFLFSPLILLRTSRRWLWIGFAMIFTFAAFFIGSAAYVARSWPSHPEALTVREVAFASSSVPAALLSATLYNILSRVVRWLS